MANINANIIFCNDVQCEGDMSCDNIVVNTSAAISEDISVGGESNLNIVNIQSNNNPFINLTPQNGQVLGYGNGEMAFITISQAGSIVSGDNINITENNSVFTIALDNDITVDSIIISGIEFPEIGLPSQVLTVNNNSTGLEWTTIESGGIDNIVSTDLGVSISNNEATINLEVQSGLSAGSYTNTNITVNNKGVITAISNGQSGGNIEGTTGEIVVTNDVISIANPISMNNATFTIDSTNNIISLTEPTGGNDNKAQLAPDSLMIQGLNNNNVVEQVEIQSDNIVLSDFLTNSVVSLSNTEINTPNLNTQALNVKNSNNLTLYSLPTSQPSNNQVIMNQNGSLNWVSLSDNGLLSISSTDNDLTVDILNENADVNLASQTITDPSCNFPSLTINSKGIITEAIQNTISAGENLGSTYTNNNLTLNLNSSLTNMQEISFSTLNDVVTSLDGDSLILQNTVNGLAVSVLTTGVNVQNTNNGDETTISSNNISTLNLQSQNIQMVNNVNLVQYSMPNELGDPAQVLTVPQNGSNLIWTTPSAVEETINQGANITITNPAPNSITVSVNDAIVLTENGSVSIGNDTIINNTDIEVVNMSCNALTVGYQNGVTQYDFPTTKGTVNQFLAMNANNSLVWTSQSGVEETIDAGVNIGITNPSPNNIVIALNDDINLTSQGSLNIDTDKVVIDVNGLTVDDGVNSSVINGESIQCNNLIVENQLTLGNNLGAYTMPIATGNAGNILQLGQNGTDIAWVGYPEAIQLVNEGANIDVTSQSATEITIALTDQVYLTSAGHLSIGDNSQALTTINNSFVSVTSDNTGITRSVTVTDDTITLLSSLGTDIIVGNGNNSIILNNNNIQKNTINNVNILLQDNSNDPLNYSCNILAGQINISDTQNNNIILTQTGLNINNTDPQNTESMSLNKDTLQILGGDKTVTLSQNGLTVLDTQLGESSITSTIITTENVDCTNLLITDLNGDLHFRLTDNIANVNIGDVLTYNGLGNDLIWSTIDLPESITTTVVFALGATQVTCGLRLVLNGTLVTGVLDISNLTIKNNDNTNLYIISGTCDLTGNGNFMPPQDDLQIVNSSVTMNNLTGVGLNFSGQTRVNAVISGAPGDTLVLGFNCTYNVSSWFEFQQNVTYDLSRLYYADGSYDPAQSLVFTYSTV